MSPMHVRRPRVWAGRKADEGHFDSMVLGGGPMPAMPPSPSVSFANPDHLSSNWQIRPTRQDQLGVPNPYDRVYDTRHVDAHAKEHFAPGKMTLDGDMTARARDERDVAVLTSYRSARAAWESKSRADTRKHMGHEQLDGKESVRSLLYHSTARVPQAILAPEEVSGGKRTYRRRPHPLAEPQGSKYFPSGTAWWHVWPGAAPPPTMSVPVSRISMQQEQMRRCTYSSTSSSQNPASYTQ